MPVRDGIATVRLNAAALQADDNARERMSAQIVWTLKQLSEVVRVRITAGGETLLVCGVAEDQDRDAWPTYDPDQLPTEPVGLRGAGRPDRPLPGGSVRAGARCRGDRRRRRCARRRCRWTPAGSRR